LLRFKLRSQPATAATEMRKVPKIVSQRLEAGNALGAAHPDANVLTAFAERCLPQADRTSVLEHLAVCGECREVIALGLPPYEPAQPLLEASPAANRTWPLFRWAFASAGVLAIALVAFVQYGHREPSGRMARNAPPPAPIQAYPNKQPASPPEDEAKASRKEQPGDTSAPAKLRKDRREPAAAPASRMVAGTLPAGSRQINEAQQHVGSVQTYGVGTKPQVPGRSTGSMATVQTRSARPDLQSQAMDSVIAANRPAPQAGAQTTLDTEVSRAKSATASQGAPSLNLAPSPAWAVTAGRLQRSFDQGITWQNVNVNTSNNNDASRTTEAAKRDENAKAASPRFRAVAVNGSEVWAGGAEANLYHSSDAGNHWSRVMPSRGSTSLTGDIVTLEFPDQQNGKITTSTGELWSTSDDGQTWNKQ
jgi:hypothetical protein